MTVIKYGINHPARVLFQTPMKGKLEEVRSAMHAASLLLREGPTDMDDDPAPA